MPGIPASSARPQPRPVDLGWLFLLPGIVLIAAAVLIAAEDDLYGARFRRDEAMAIERRHAARVERYEAYLDAVKRRDPTVVRSLVAGQLNAEPTDLVEANLPGAMVYDPGQVFASLEPPEAEPARRQRVDSVLARWATDDSSRVWLMASGALCVFVGLLPPVARRARTAPVPGDAAEDGADPVAEGLDEAEEDLDAVDEDGDADGDDGDGAEDDAIDSEALAADDTEAASLDEEADEEIEDESGDSGDDLDDADDSAADELDDDADGDADEVDEVDDEASEAPSATVVARRSAAERPA